MPSSPSRLFQQPARAPFCATRLSAYSCLRARFAQRKMAAMLVVARRGLRLGPHERAARLRPWATGVEFAPLRPVQDARHLALKLDGLPPSIRIGVRLRRPESVRVGVGG